MTRRRIVLATGAFDLLHLGHIRFLRESKKRGGQNSRLFVVVARDRTVRERKGRAPTIPENERREIVASLKTVDKAMLGHEKLDMLGILKEVRPDVVSLGYDQNDIKISVVKLIKSNRLGIRVVQIPKLGRNALNNSTKLKAKIARDWERSN